MANYHLMKFTSSKPEEFLCLAIRHINRIKSDELFNFYNSIRDIDIYNAAQKNGVTSIVAHAMISHFPKNFDIPVHWSNAYQEVKTCITEYMAELDRVANRLFKHDIPLISLKNSGIARGLYQHLGASPMGDLDVLILPEHFYEAHDVLVDMGYTLKFRNVFEKDDIEEAFKNGGSEYFIILSSGVTLWLELQWRPISGRWIRPKQEPQGINLFAKANTIDGSNALLLGPEDNLLQVCLHTAKHSFVRAPGFRLHTDVDRIVSSVDINWEVFICEVKNLHVKTAVYLSLILAYNLLNTPIPAHVLDEIKPSNLKVKILLYWLNKVGLFNPDDKKWSNFGFIIFVALMYDRFTDLIRSIFPPLHEMQMNNQTVSRANLLWAYKTRILSLIFRRTGI